MDEEQFGGLIAHILLTAQPGQAEAVLRELLDCLRREEADERYAKLTEEAVECAAELRALAIAGRSFSLEAMEAFFEKRRELEGC